MMAIAGGAGSGTVVLHHVPPKFYAALVAAAADDVRARIAFDGETVEIVRPPPIANAVLASSID